MKRDDGCNALTTVPGTWSELNRYRFASFLFRARHGFLISVIVVGRILKMYPQDSCPLVIESNTHLGTAVKGFCRGT